MRARNVVSAAAMVVLGFCGAASAGLIVYDHFDNPATSLNMTLWQLQDTTTPGVSNSQVVVQNSGWQEINSSAAWDMRTTTYELQYAGGSGSQQFLGIGNYPIVTEGYRSVILRSDGGWSLFSNAVSGPSGPNAFVPITAPVAGDIFDFTYNSGTGNVDLYKNGGTTPIASVPCDLNQIISPNKTMELYYGVTGGSQVTSDYAGTIANVPEPSTFVLLVAGLLGLLAYAWRKRR